MTHGSRGRPWSDQGLHYSAGVKNSMQKPLTNKQTPCLSNGRNTPMTDLYDLYRCALNIDLKDKSAMMKRETTNEN